MRGALICQEKLECLELDGGKLPLMSPVAALCAAEFHIAGFWVTSLNTTDGILLNPDNTIQVFYEVTDKIFSAIP